MIIFYMGVEWSGVVERGGSGEKTAKSASLPLLPPVSSPLPISPFCLLQIGAFSSHPLNIASFPRHNNN